MFDKSQTDKNNTLCPACGYDLGFPAWNGENPSDEICPSCGIQFGYNDGVTDVKRRVDIYNGWRAKWSTDGMNWYSTGMKKPEGWNPKEQLKELEKWHNT